MSQDRQHRFQFARRSNQRVAADVDEELEFHLESVAADLRRAGWSATDARLESVRRFGDLQRTRDYCRDEDVRREQEKRRMTLLDELGQDLRYALRSLRFSPGFTAAALLTLALGIGANTAIFSVVRGVLLAPLPFSRPNELVRVWNANPTAGIDRGSVSEPDFLDWRRDTKVAASLGAYFFMDGLSGLDLTGVGNPERLSTALVTDGFFQTLGTPPLLGRTLQPDDHVPGRDRVVVLSHTLWTRRFGADRTIIGRKVALNEQPFEVVGVMPPGYIYPADRTIDGWIPLSFYGPDQIGRSRGSRFLGVIARLRQGASQMQLDDDLSTMSKRLSTQYADHPGWTDVTTLPLRDSVFGEVQRPLLLLMGAVAMLLLIACVNIASLLLARASGRQRELAVRAAIGAGRRRIVRQLLTESLTLAILGGALGTALGVAAVRALGSAGASELPRATEIRVDGFVLAFTLGISLLSGLLFGVAPALRASRANLHGMLGAGARGSVGAAGQRLRSTLVVIEVALAVILVVGAGLATKSFSRLLSVDPGFRAEKALVATLSVSDKHDTPAARQVFYYSVLDAIRAVPGVQSAGAIRDLPLRGRGEMVQFTIPGRSTAPGEGINVQLHQVSTDYFKALGTPLRAGRAFEMSDDSNAPRVLVMNEEFARRVWPGRDVVGEVVRLGNTEVRVIGVVANVRQNGIAEDVEPAAYVHVLQNLRSRMSIVVRTSGNPADYFEAVRRAIWSVDPNQTITGVTTLEAVLGDSVSRPRLLAWLLALFGSMGLALGALGIFGVLAYAVNQRRQEIGVRVALGASPGSVLRLVVGYGIVLAGIGVAAGVVGAAILTRTMQSVLYGIEASDAATFVQVVVVLMGVALLASWLPSRRALAIDPVTALRND